ncbi:MAG TPA: hypothetical protein PLC99_20500 [Verrucomicrobiota bacterium]|nr:hypothetical protein [Verrucomicrobiota bacterium]
MPSPERVQRALELICKRGANHEYFFAKLSSPAWIAPLAEAGLFSSPPDPVREGDSISFPLWPESRFLARMAALEPDLVLGIVEKAPVTDNVRVHEDFCDAAIAMPGRQAAQLARRELMWIEQQPHLYFLLPERLGQLIEHLAITDEHKTALLLARAVLRIHRTSGHGAPSALFDSWDYDQFLLNHLPPLLAAQPAKTLALLCDCLAETLVGENVETTSPEDYSWIWRPAIEDHEQNHGPDNLRDVLIRSVRDGARTMVVEQIATVNEVMAEFDRREWFIFKRLGLHLLVEFFEAAKDEARARVLSKENFETIQVHHEYGRLLQAVFPELNTAERDRVLEWMCAPPVGGDDTPRARDHRVLQQLVLLDGKLPPTWQKRLDDLKTQLGQPDHPEFLSYGTSWVGPTSPLDRSALKSMTATLVADYCRTWVPVRDWNSPTREGLARTLQADVAKRATEYVSALPAFEGTDATYARSIVQGLAAASKANATFEWPPVVKFLEWIVRQERSIPGRSGKHLNEDPHWGWARKAVADLIGVACERDAMPYSLRDCVWRLLGAISTDPDPSPRDDQQASMDPATMSINTTRGEAMHAVVRFALWEHRAEGRERETSRMPDDVRSLLSQHLDPALEPSLAVRAVYGQWLPWLVMMDREWVATNLPLIVPDAEEHKGARAAAWNAYVTFCRPYDDVFLLLARHYAGAVSRLGERVQTQHRSRDEEDALGEHLMLLAARGRIAWDDEGALLPTFFERAPAAVAEHTIAFGGRVLRNEEHPLSAEVVHRFVVLWERVRARLMASGSENGSPLKAFGWWFASGRFEPEWAAHELLDVLRCTGQIDAAFLVYKALETLASTNAPLAVSVLRELVRADHGGRNLIGSKDHMRAILAAGLRSAEAAEAAQQVIHELGARGHFEFRDLLGKQPSRDGSCG